jgi:hypothetical protein
LKQDPQASREDLLDRAPTDLIHHELRREGKVVAIFRGVRSEAGATVETRVFPITAARDNMTGIDRSFPFPSVDQARSFVDETIMALEYLGCTVV